MNPVADVQASLERHRRYNHSDKGRARNARYEASGKGRVRVARYRLTPKGVFTKYICNDNKAIKRLERLVADVKAEIAERTA